MKSTVATVGFGLVLTFALLQLGRWLYVSESSPAMVRMMGLDWDYMKALGPEIGGSGIDAILIGGVAGYIATKLSRWHQIERQQGSITRRRERNRPIKLSQELSLFAGPLRLSGLAFASDCIPDLEIYGTKFSGEDMTASSFHEVSFEGCVLKGVDFRGCKLTNIHFDHCILNRCRFDKVAMSVSDGRQPFETAQLVRCTFDGADLVGVDFREIDQRGCSFWGATFRGGARMPNRLYQALKEGGLKDATSDGAGLRVRSRFSLLRSLEPRFLKVLVEQLVAPPARR